MNVMEISVGQEASRYSHNADEKIILDAERQISSTVREARLANRLQEKQNQKQFELEEGILYGPGICD